MNFVKRTDTCGNLRKEDMGKKIVLNGWIAKNRDLGGVVFIDLRDRWGITQLVINPSQSPELAERANELGSEYVIWAQGTVQMRENPNLNIPTGLIEILLDDFGIINKAELPPFEIIPDIETSEEIRLKYRYLDLRRQDIQRNMMIRSKAYQMVHQYFAENDFIEIETPFFAKSTPEGARSFLVPSRINKGRFYALPQSPQLYKQILMISGYDRYMQIVKCFRDEDLRSDRQPEFTQIDVEMSFIEREDIFKLTEGLISRLWKGILDIGITTPFKQMTFKETMERFGSDKPDIRFGLELKSINSAIANSEFKVFSDAINNEGEVAALNAVGCASYSRKQIDELTELAKKYGAKGLAWIKLVDGQVNSPIAKFLTEQELNSIFEITGAKDGDLILIAADKWLRAYTVLGALRLEIAKQTKILEVVKGQFSFHWVIDFPLLEFDNEENRYVAIHHPFTSPMDEDIHLLDSAPEKARAKAYDLVVNGAELGGGSIRIHDGNIQNKMFELLGFTPDEAESKFGFLLQALKYGAPPHGGVAFGLDRIVMTLAGIDNIRDVIAFPKTTSGLSLMDGSPSYVEEKQLNELGIRVVLEK